MKSFSAVEAARKFGEMLKLADEVPIEITRHGKRRRYVLMSAQLFEAYEMMRRAHAEERILATVQHGIGKILAGSDQEGFRVVRMGSGMMQRFLDATGEKL